MMAQNDLVVVGIDVAKDKVDVYMRPLALRQAYPCTAKGQRELMAWLRKHKAAKAVMEASGGYERSWAKTLRAAGIEVRIVDPKRVRSFARSAGRLAKNDTIDAEMIAWFAETFDQAPHQTYDAAREKLAQMVNARQGLLDLQTTLQNRDEHSDVQEVHQMHARLLKKKPGLLSPSPVRCASIVTELTSASRCQDHTTSPSAHVRIRLARHSRPPHPAQRS